MKKYHPTAMSCKSIWSHFEMIPTVIIESEKPNEIVYKRGSVYMKLKGYHAMLYQQMIWRYGKAKATEKYWWLWNKKEGSAV